MKKRYHDEVYFKLLNDVVSNGCEKTDRTGTGTISKFGASMYFDISDMSIPLLTTKKMNLNSILHEIIWYISGNTNIKYLNDNGVKIWNAWADKNGDLGPVYGEQWRKVPNYVIDKNDIWLSHEKPFIDQLSEAINLIKTDPTSRRIMVNSWNVSQLEEMRLPPCHYQFSFWCKPYNTLQRLYLLSKVLQESSENLGKLDNIDLSLLLDAHKIPLGELYCKLDMRSNDLFLGCPFNIVQYAILTHMIAHVTNYTGCGLMYTCTDAHIYINHLDQVTKQLNRNPREFASPTISFDKNINSIDDFTFESFHIDNYKYMSAITAPVAV